MCMCLSGRRKHKLLPELAVLVAMCCLQGMGLFIRVVQN